MHFICAFYFGLCRLTAPRYCSVPTVEKIHPLQIHKESTSFVLPNYCTENITFWIEFLGAEVWGSVKYKMKQSYFGKSFCLFFCLLWCNLSKKELWTMCASVQVVGSQIARFSPSADWCCLWPRLVVGTPTIPYHTIPWWEAQPGNEAFGKVAGGTKAFQGFNKRFATCPPLLFSRQRQRWLWQVGWLGDTRYRRILWDRLILPKIKQTA